MATLRELLGLGDDDDDRVDGRDLPELTEPGSDALLLLGLLRFLRRRFGEPDGPLSD